MKIVFVQDDITSRGNGAAITAMRFADELRNRGHEVRIVSLNVNLAKTRNIPFISKAARKQNIFFAKPDKKILADTFKDADVVHTFFPWKLSRVARKLAVEHGIAFTTSFHVHPDNITYTMRLQWFKPLAWGLMRYWGKHYNKCEFIQTPSQYATNFCKSHGYKGNFYVISNAVNDFFVPPVNQPQNDMFRIISVGRLAAEKRQDIIIKAVSKSKHRDKIFLSFWGSGPNYKKYKRLARKMLPAGNVFFRASHTKASFEASELLQEFHKSDLYIHSADVEIEGMSCIEALASGVPCLISDAPRSATKKFAVDKERCLFTAGDAQDLADKIDWLIDNPVELANIRDRYIIESDKYRIRHSIEQFENFLQDAIQKLKK